MITGFHTTFQLQEPLSEYLSCNLGISFLLYFRVTTHISKNSLKQFVVGNFYVIDDDCTPEILLRFPCLQTS